MGFSGHINKDFKAIQEVAELAAWQGHCNAFSNDMNKLSFTLVTEQKLKYIKSQESGLKNNALLKILEAN